MEADEDRIRDRVRELLQAEGWAVQAGSGTNLRWAFRAEDPGHRIFLVGQPIGRPDLVELAAKVTVADAHKDKLAQLTDAARESFLWELRFGLLDKGVEFQDISLPLDKMTLFDRTYADNLGQDTLMHRISNLRRALLYVLWMFEARVGGAPGKLPLGYRLNK